MHDPLDDGRKPLMQIGALLVTLAMVIGTVASGIALAVASLPPEFERFAQAVAFVGPLGAALTIGLTAIGKGLYQIGKGQATALVEAEEPADDEVGDEPDDGFGAVSTGGAHDAILPRAEEIDAEAGA